GRLVPKRRRHWSGASTHQSGTPVPGAATHRPGACAQSAAASEDVVPAGFHRAIEPERIAVRTRRADAPVGSCCSAGHGVEEQPAAPAGAHDSVAAPAAVEPEAVYRGRTDDRAMV